MIAPLLLGAVAVALAARRRPDYSLRGRAVVIVGGSRGLGLELAREYGLQGARLALLARDPEELERARVDLRARGITAITCPCDLLDREQIFAAIDSVARDLGRIDVLVNNAGLIQVGPFSSLTFEDFEQAMAVHLYGPLAAIVAALPHLRSAGGGRIVNIASIGGAIAAPHLLAYTASKFALSGLSQGLRAELARERILVTTVYPGLMRTGSPRNALFKGRAHAEHAWFAVADALPGLSMSSSRAAAQIVQACRRGSARLVVGWPAKAAIAAQHLAPAWVAEATALVNRLLPDPPRGSAGRTSRPGREVPSRWAPSLLTRLSDQAAARNNE